VLTFQALRLTPLMVLELNFENCWGLVRASNTTPCLVVRFEGSDKEALNSIKSQFKDWLETNNISTKSL